MSANFSSNHQLLTQKGNLEEGQKYIFNHDQLFIRPLFRPFSISYLRKSESHSQAGLATFHPPAMKITTKFSLLEQSRPLFAFSYQETLDKRSFTAWHRWKITISAIILQKNL